MVKNLPSFVSTLLDHGLELDKFVTLERLETLYQKVSHNPLPTTADFSVTATQQT